MADRVRERVDTFHLETAFYPVLVTLVTFSHFQAKTERLDPNRQRQLGEGWPEPLLIVHHVLQEVKAGQRWQEHQEQGWRGEDGGDQPDFPPVRQRQQAARVDEEGQAAGGGDEGGGEGG